MSSPALEMVEVSKVYEVGGTEIVALDHVDLIVDAAEVVTLLGPSGSGKSTLLSIAGGLLSPTAGRVVVGGDDITRASSRKLTAFRRKRVGFIFQSVNLVPFLTARENLLVVAQLARRRPAEAKRRADRLLEELGLGHRTGNLPAQLSGGERQRVAIGRALMNQPALVLVDEPTSALDSDRGQQVMQLIVSEVKAREAAAVIVTHDARMTRYGDRILNMADGRIAGMEPRPEWTLNRPEDTATPQVVQHEHPAWIPAPAPTPLAPLAPVAPDRTPHRDRAPQPHPPLRPTARQATTPPRSPSPATPPPGPPARPATAPPRSPQPATAPPRPAARSPFPASAPPPGTAPPPGRAAPLSASPAAGPPRASAPARPPSPAAGPPTVPPRSPAPVPRAPLPATAPPRPPQPATPPRPAARSRMPGAGQPRSPSPESAPPSVTAPFPSPSAPPRASLPATTQPSAAAPPRAPATGRAPGVPPGGPSSPAAGRRGAKPGVRPSPPGTRQRRGGRPREDDPTEPPLLPLQPEHSWPDPGPPGGADPDQGEGIWPDRWWLSDDPDG